MPADWAVVPNDELRDDLVEQGSALIQTWFPDAPSTIVSPADLRWKLGPDNPAGPGHMTVAVADGAVVGTMTVTRKRFVLRGEEVAAAEVGDTFTDPRYLRGGQTSMPWAGEADRQQYLDRSVFGRLTTETMARADDAGVSLYFGVANETAMPGYIKRLGFRRWEGAPLVTFSRPGAELLASRSRLPQPVARAVERAHAVAADLALVGLRGLRRSELRPGDDLGPIDELWARVLTQWPLQPVRDSSWFRYRFFEHPTAQYRVWLLHRRGTVVGAYATRTFDDGHRHRVTYLAERMLDTGQPGLLPAAFAGAVRTEGGAADQHASITWSQEPWATGARRFGGVVETFRNGLILRDNPAHPLDLHGIDVFPFTTATSDNV